MHVPPIAELYSVSLIQLWVAQLATESRLSYAYFSGRCCLLDARRPTDLLNNHLRRCCSSWTGAERKWFSEDRATHVDLWHAVYKRARCHCLTSAQYSWQPLGRELASATQTLDVMAPFLACSVVIVTTFLVVFVWLRKVRPKSAFGRAIPPRVPGSLPWLGNVLRIDKQRPHVTLTEWYEKLGHVYR